MTHVIYIIHVLKFRSIRRGCSVRKGVIKNVAKFTKKHLCQSLFFNKVASLSHCRPQVFLVYIKMTNSYYQKHKENLRKEARKRYQNLFKEEKERRQKMSQTNIKSF